ncbi:cell wall metabolism sensor histidine kinase WalK [Mycobacterium sp. SMC-4]|uniref:sensor histidine kinase n=1 Tax=Mycobacterium sp. SMC-4 TaxID=2857059 RepID=UPI0021B1AEFF|nr:HAMP domain-containing sensor histidine kinase [Mycobacterium sp. SMC-4]UXA16774.1 HAMP domain-containing histidine kinase [Mycobacterium sp. SMC-4]
MSSNQPGDRRGLRSPRSWSLRTRLLVTQLLLLAGACAGIGVATEFGLQRFLTGQLDEQVIEAGRRSTVMFDHGPPPGGPVMMRPPGMPGGPAPGPRIGIRMGMREDGGPGPVFLNAPGQAIGAVGAVVADGRTVSAGVITENGARAQVSAVAATQLTEVAVGRGPRTVDLDGLGRYRVVAFPSLATSQTVVTGLPTADVDDTMLQALVIFGAVAGVALAVVAGLGAVLVRREMAPLARVSEAAQQVADLELDRGEVRLPSPIVDVDPVAAGTEVGRLGTALNRMLDRIADALKARHASETRVRQFVADASHELRTPLAAIRGYTELAQRRHADLPEDVAHAMSRVESETARLTHLVEDMLLLARLDSGRPLQRRPVDLSRLLVDAVSDAQVAGPGHRWLLDLPEEPVHVAGDEARLHQVLANLLANARTHTPDGTSVTTSLSERADGTVVLTVADDGPGVPAELLPDVFERFARGDSSRSRREGSTGLGLAIVEAVVRAHGGSIVVDSAPGATRFVVSLPGWSPVSDSSAESGDSDP